MLVRKLMSRATEDAAILLASSAHGFESFSRKLSTLQVADAVMRSNRNVGGSVVEASGTWSIVRGRGLIGHNLLTEGA